MQHYHTVHGKKNYECGKCGKKFGLRDMCHRHEKECGQVFQCPMCDEEFCSKNALYQHTKRKGHKLPTSTPVSSEDRQDRFAQLYWYLCFAM